MPDIAVMGKSPINVIIFARVSTRDKQDTARQVNELTEYCQRKEWNVIEVVTEQITGTEHNNKRPGVIRMMEIVRTHTVSKIVISEVSRIGRNTLQVLELIEQLRLLGVSLHIMNYELDTISNERDNPMAMFMITLLTDVARMEREQLVERIKSGQAEARRKGKRIGRPPRTEDGPALIIRKYPKVVKKLNQGHSIRDIAAMCSVSTNTVQKVKRAITTVNQ